MLLYIALPPSADREANAHAQASAFSLKIFRRETGLPQKAQQGVVSREQITREPAYGTSGGFALRASSSASCGNQALAAGSTMPHRGSKRFCPSPTKPQGL